jgi:hypothetical protein
LIKAPAGIVLNEAVTHSAVAGKIEQHKPERLVTLQPEVLSDAEHALGNLLQRLRHAARRSAGDGFEPERLHGALEELEGLLELIFDYVSPVDVELRPISASRIAESLAGQVRTYSPAGVSVGRLPVVQMPLDRRLLSRSFALLGRAIGRHWQNSSGTFVGARFDEGLERVEFTLRSALPNPCDGLVGGQEQLAFAVARRLIELQGGELCYSQSADQVECHIVLPAPRSTDAGG